MVKSRRNVSRRKRQYKRQQKRQKSIRRNFKKMWGGGLISDKNDAKTKLSTAMIDDIVYKNTIGERKKFLLSNTVNKLNEITDFDEYPAFGAPDILGKVFVNNVLKFKEDPHQANMLKIAAANKKAEEEEEARQSKIRDDIIAEQKAQTEKDIAWYREMGKRDLSHVTPRHPPNGGGYGYANK